MPKLSPFTCTTKTSKKMSFHANIPPESNMFHGRPCRAYEKVGSRYRRPLLHRPSRTFPNLSSQDFWASPSRHLARAGSPALSAHSAAETALIELLSCTLLEKACPSKPSLRDRYLAHERARPCESAPPKLRPAPRPKPAKNPTTRRHIQKMGPSTTMSSVSTKQHDTLPRSSVPKAYRHKPVSCHKGNESSGRVLLDPGSIIRIVDSFAPAFLKAVKKTATQLSVNIDSRSTSHGAQPSEKRPSLRGGRNIRRGLTSSSTAPIQPMFGVFARRTIFTDNEYSGLDTHRQRTEDITTSPGIPRSRGRYNLAECLEETRYEL